MNTSAVRTVRKVGRPRPLKITTERVVSSPLSPSTMLDSTSTKRTITDSLNDLENLHISISNGNFDESTARDVAQIYGILKSRGSELDISFKEQLDRYFATLRTVSREDRLDMASRLRLLEVIELRAMKWKSNENLDAYYRERLIELQALQRSITSAPIPPPIMPAVPFMQSHPQMLQSSVPPLEPGEVLRSSGKFAKPTKVAGKNYFKDEILIRNSDSGKVMGIKGRRVHMIEELSDTIISFQRVSPGARDRLVQITGPHEEAIGHAKILVEDTIRRNASPVREKREQLDVEDEENDNLNCFNQNYYEETGLENFGFRNPLTHSLSMNNASLGKYTFNISVGESSIEVSGENVEIVKMAKLVLEAYFDGQAENGKDQPERIPSPVPPSIGAFPASDVSRVNLNKHQTLRQSTSLPTDVEEMLNSPFHSSSEDETKSGPMKLSRSNLSSNTVLPPTICYSSETSLAEGTLSHVETGNSQSMPIPYACEKIRYSREFLLNCAKLKYSHVEPKDFSRIARDFPLICKEVSSSNTYYYSIEVHHVKGTFSHVETDSSMSVTNAHACEKIRYSREFLLGCAKLKCNLFETNDFSRIARDFPLIYKEPSKLFDPEEYKEQLESQILENSNGNEKLSA